VVAEEDTFVAVNLFEHTELIDDILSRGTESEFFVGIMRNESYILDKKAEGGRERSLFDEAYRWESFDYRSSIIFNIPSEDITYAGSIQNIRKVHEVISRSFPSAEYRIEPELCFDEDYRREMCCDATLDEQYRDSIFYDLGELLEDEPFNRNSLKQ